MGKGTGGQVSREFKERMAEQIMSRALFGNEGGQSEPERPDYCGECQFFEPAGSVPASDGADIIWGQGPVCQLEPPKVVVVHTKLLNGVEPITRAERLACRHGIRKS